MNKYNQERGAVNAKISRRMKITRHFTTIIISTALAAGFFMSGCASKKEKKIILRWAGYTSPGYNEFRMRQGDEFEKLHPEVEVKYEPISGKYNSKILTQIAGGVAPDIFFVNDLQTFVEKGALVDLTSWIKEDKEYFEDFWPPSLMDSLKWNDRIYTLPGNNGVTGLLFYNKDMFDKEKLPYPDENWTWKDLLDAAKKLTKRDAKGRVIQYGCVNQVSLVFYIFQNGGTIWNKDRSRCIINSPESQEALEFWRDLYIKHHVSPSPSEEKSVQKGMNAFIMGRAAMLCGSDWHIAKFKFGGIKINWDATLLPIPKKGKKRFAFMVPLRYGIWSGSKHPKLAYELAKSLISPEQIKFLIEVGDSIPIRNKGIEMDAFLASTNRSERMKKAVLKTLEFSVSRYHVVAGPIPYMEQEEIIRRNLEMFTLGNMSAEEVLQKIQDELNQKITQH